MKREKFEVAHEHNRIYIRLYYPEGKKIGFTDYADELWKIIALAKWHLKKGKYIYSGNQSLHRIVMEYWYGKECCVEMIEKGFVIDHIDNDSLNCSYENLAFLSRAKNWHYKGNYYDKERVDAIPIAAVNIMKKMGEGKFQITVGFNKSFVNSQGQKISTAFFAYDVNDYDLVLADALMLVESMKKGEINIKNLRYDRYKFTPFCHVKIDNPDLKSGSIIEVDGEILIVHRQDFPVFQKIAPDTTLW
ncbi:MAG: HNH endonuclease [Chloroflexi bacterium]|nr:HNH endonuclease [Chloroflexota bacterium]